MIASKIVNRNFFEIRKRIRNNQHNLSGSILITTDDALNIKRNVFK